RVGVVVRGAAFARRLLRDAVCALNDRRLGGDMVEREGKARGLMRSHSAHALALAFLAGKTHRPIVEPDARQSLVVDDRRAGHLHRGAADAIIEEELAGVLISESDMREDDVAHRPLRFAMSDAGHKRGAKPCRLIAKTTQLTTALFA